MAPFKSSDGRNIGKLVQSYSSEFIGSDLAAQFSASGGVKVMSGNTNWHVFTGPGSFEANSTGKACEILIIAGGGGGGSAYYSGGGGAGGLVKGAISLNALSTPITTGAKGIGRHHALTTRGTNGGNSTFGAITAIGGGGGGSYASAAGGLDGGSSGGTSGYDTSTRAPATPQPVPGDYTAHGFRGNVGGNYGAGGGGGAGAEGNAGGPSVGGAGGAGLAVPNFPGNDIFDNAPSALQTILTPGWKAAVGANGTYAGGGGGSNYSTGGGAAGAGGAGGGAPGQPGPGHVLPFPDAVNYTGSGGGGANYGQDYTNDYGGSDGAQGIVIVRYVN